MFGRKFDDESDDEELDMSKLQKKGADSKKKKRVSALDADSDSDDDFTRGSNNASQEDWAAKRQALISDYRKKSKTAKQVVQRRKRPKV